MVATCGYSFMSVKADNYPTLAFPCQIVRIPEQWMVGAHPSATQWRYNVLPSPQNFRLPSWIWNRSKCKKTAPCGQGWSAIHLR